MRYNQPNTLFHIDAGKAPVHRDTPALTRRYWLRLGAAAGLAGTLPALRAQPQPPFPARPLQLIVPWPAGGQTDLTLRVLAEEASGLLGQPVVVVNRPGAAGTLVAPLLKAAAPDGHTIGQVPITVYRHALMHTVPWNPLTDLAPILQISSVSFGLLVPVQSPFRSVAALIDWAQAHPGHLLMGSTGVGTTAHLAMEDILQTHGVNYVHVPYKGTADQMLAIANGHVMAGVNSTGFAPWVDKGQMRLLALFNATRSARWPNVPTMRELGYPQAVYTSPWGLAAPAHTPSAIIQKLHDAFGQAAHSDRYRAALARYEQALDYLGTREYRQALLETIEREKQLLARMNLLAHSPS